MRLRHQLNLSFILLVISVLTLTSILFYMLSFQILLSLQRNELQARGTAWIQSAISENQTFYRRDLKRLEKIPTKTGNIDVVLYRSDQQALLYSSLGQFKTNQVISKIKVSVKKREKTVWTINGSQYIIEKWSLKAQKKQNLVLVIASPLKGIKVLQAKFSRILFIVLLIGGLIAFLISHFITRRLINPLSKVNEQLKKVEHREFDQLEKIEASGEIGEVANTSYQMAKELHQYIESQKHFFQNASHELKTPLMSIQGFAEGILDGVFQEDRATHALNMIIKESERLKQLVNEITLLAKLESYEGLSCLNTIAF